jgi:dinuclear metal center YbgI/SA1388 family protein
MRSDFLHTLSTVPSFSVKLESILQYLDEYLAVSGHPDYPTALNGLQVDGPAEVETVVTAVDASMASITAAADLGLFWEGLQPVVGRRFQRLEALIVAEIALYSCHLPLDAHPEVGNCACLARAIGLELEGRLGRYQDADIGWWGSLAEPTTAAGLADLVSTGVGGGPVRVLDGGPDRVSTVGVVTGEGGAFVREAAEAGLDAFVTGEGSHHTFFDAAEFGTHVLFAGHYATETFGVRALGAHLTERFGMDSHFIDLPTGL